MRRLVLSLTLASVTAFAQTATSDQQDGKSDSDAANRPVVTQIVVPAGTKVLLHLQSPIDTKSARVGDGVYCQTSFPITIDNTVVIPAGTYVKGEIAKVQRPGRIKGRAELLFHFNTMIYPNGYTVDLPGALQNQPGATNSKVSDQEGTVQANGQKGKDGATVAKDAGGGAAIGALSTGTAKGTGIGAGLGGAVGLATVLLTRGQDVRIEQGAALEMVLQRDLTVDVNHLGRSRAETDLVPRQRGERRLRVPPPNDRNPN